MAHLAIDRQFTLRTLEELVRIDSVNPRLASSGAGEAAIARYIASVLDSLGLQTEIREPEAGRATAIGVLKGQGGGRSLMLNGHADTVGVEGMAEPFAARQSDGRVYGRGAHDMKGSLAAGLGALKALRDAGLTLDGDLVFAAVADEEYGSLGTSDLLTAYRTDAAVVTEPTNLAVCLAHKGYAWIEVETRGRAAHGSRFTEGIDANLRMGRVLGALERLERQLRDGPAHALVGPPSLHAALLNGGSGLSTYADRCTLTIERRTVPGETVDGAVGEIREIVARLCGADPAFEAEVRLLFARDPWEIAPDAPIVQAVCDAASAVLGARPPFVGDSPWMDSALLAAAGIETVVVGPTGAGEHSAEEWVDVESVMRVAEILAGTARTYCRRME